MLRSIRGVPWGIGLFLAYAFGILAGVGVSLRFVIDQAIDAPVSFIGVVVMALLAYTIFTITLVIQRKVAARDFAIGLSSLTVPPIPLGLLFGLPVVAVFCAVLAVLLFRGLRAPATRTWLDQV